MMSCFLHAADALPADSNSGSSCAPNYSKSSVFPGFCFEFRAVERDYMGLGQVSEQQSADQKNIGFPLTSPILPLTDTSPIDDLCGSHLKLAPPSHGDEDREGDADDGVEEHTSANIGWPPISSYRRSTTRGLAMKPPCNTETVAPLIVHEAPFEDAAPARNSGDITGDSTGEYGRKNDESMHRQSSLLVVTTTQKVPLHIKVSMDGTPIMRKLNLKSMHGYHQLSLELHKLFRFFKGGLSCEAGVRSCFKDLSGAKFLLTYKDGDGDWMLVGDTPWESFARSARRIRIMKKSK